MPLPNAQPVLPAEGVYNDLEQLFITEQPRNLWPINQNSNAGALRKVVTDELMVALSTLAELSLERFVETSSGYLTLWEAMVGLPGAPGGLTEAERRALILTRLRKGPFTRSRRADAVEAHLQATFGVPISLVPEGVPLDPGGTPLYGEAGTIYDLYRIYEDVKNFKYEVLIRNDATPDMVSLVRELERITPDGITVVINNSVSTVLDYGRVVKDKAAVLHLRLGADYNDYSGFANHGTANGTITTVASPGLLTAGPLNTDGARDFNGTTGYVTVPDANQLDVGDNFTLEAWLRPDTISGIDVVADKGTNGFRWVIDAGVVKLEKKGVGTIVGATIPLVAGTKYHVAVTKKGSLVKLWIDSLDRTGTIVNQTVESTGTTLHVGRDAGGATNFYDGAMDEFAIYHYALSAAQVLDNFNMGNNVGGAPPGIETFDSGIYDGDTYG